MNLEIMNINNVPVPTDGYGYMFIDAIDNKLKIKKTNSVIEYTNTLNDIQLLDLTDCTSYDVYAHTAAIPAGSTIIGETVYNDSTLKVSRAISAQTVETFGIRTDVYYEDSDIVIDWGDGTIEQLSIKSDLYLWKNNSLIDPMEQRGESYNYICKHDYATTGKFTIKIFGKDYFGIRHYTSNEAGESLLCKCFTHYLTTAKHVTNLASFALGSVRLLKVQFPFYDSIFQRITNWSGCFSSCSNLLSATEFNIYNKVRSLYGIFNYCYSLTTTDIQMSPSYDGLETMFLFCSKLTGDINTFLKGFNEQTGTFNVNGLFKNCKSLHSSDYITLGKKLWNNKNVIWKNTSSAFNMTINSGDVVNIDLTQIPTSWRRYW
jgi:hypothetical protein